MLRIRPMCRSMSVYTAILSKTLQGIQAFLLGLLKKRPTKYIQSDDELTW